jgi:hypothetical protein
LVVHVVDVALDRGRDRGRRDDETKATSAQRLFEIKVRFGIAELVRALTNELLLQMVEEATRRYVASAGGPPIGMKYVALEILDRHPPYARGVVDQLGHHLTGVRVALLLDLDDAKPPGRIEQHKVGSACIEPCFSTDNGDLAHAEILDRDELWVFGQYVMKALLREQLCLRRDPLACPVPHQHRTWHLEYTLSEA